MPEPGPAGLKLEGRWAESGGQVEGSLAAGCTPLLDPPAPLSPGPQALGARGLVPRLWAGSPPTGPRHCTGTLLVLKKREVTRGSRSDVPDPGLQREVPQHCPWPRARWPLYTRLGSSVSDCYCR